jgi:PAS domain-containing protein
MATQPPLTSRVRLVCLPASDGAFAENVTAIFETERPGTAEELERRLRPTYPRVRVQRRDLVGEVDEHWYVFREAPYVPPGENRWWRSPRTPHVAVTFLGVAVEANDAVCELLRTSRDELLGHHYERWVPSDVRRDAAALLAIVLRRRSGASLVTLQRADGTRVEVEWHARVHGARLHAWFRPIE